MRFKYLMITALFFLINSFCFAQYDGYELNANGSFAVGGCYDGYKLNTDGSYAVGGAYDGYKLNADGSYSVGKGKCKK